MSTLTGYVLVDENFNYPLPGPGDARSDSPLDFTPPNSVTMPDNTNPWHGFMVFNTYDGAAGFVGGNVNQIVKVTFDSVDDVVLPPGYDELLEPPYPSVIEEGQITQAHLDEMHEGGYWVSHCDVVEIATS